MSPLTLNFLHLSVLTAAVSLTTSCSGNKIPLQPFYSSNDCAISKQTVIRIENQNQLNEILKPRSMFSTGSRAEMTSFDFEREELILVAMGSKPSMGYVISWSNDPAMLHNGDLYLPIELRDPPPDQIQAQVMTSPCRIFSLPKSEYRQIRLRDNECKTQCP